jgi:REP element-mobilizing transposase RayT
MGALKGRYIQQADITSAQGASHKMPQSLSRLIVHIVFSTKARVPILRESIRGELYAYLAGVLRNLECPAIKLAPFRRTLKTIHRRDAETRRKAHSSCSLRLCVSAVKNGNSYTIKLGGTADHMHLLCLLSKNLALAKLVEEFKTGSSRWLKTKGPEFQSFHWQSGYGGFSVGESGLEAATRYIDQQEEHHRKVSFQDEYRMLLEKYRVPYDERFVWD